MHIRLRRIVDTITVDNFKEKSEEIINFLSMPYDHIGGIYEFIEETGYIIRSKRYKYSDEKLRESFKWTIESSLEQLEKYGPMKRFKVVK
nr:MAG TPA: hypothetical protein [Caudoviricetes sp.]